jgi:CheY-like chemotaxis protein
MTIPAKPLRVLLVDDEPAILRMFRAALHGTKFTFSQAHDGREALERLGVTEVDVVVTDINMPGQGGLEFLRSMRGSHPHIPVIVMTGKPSSESQNEASIHGAVRYLVKPVLPATLRDAIERAAAHGTAPRVPLEQAVLVRCICETCARAGISAKLGSEWSRAPDGWFGDGSGKRYVCSEACAREAERKGKARG